MSALALMLVTFAGVPAAERKNAAAGLLSAATRYAFSAFGPISISAAHFLAAVIYLHWLPRTDFGLFSFLLVVAPFSLSICGSMFAPPIAREVARPGGIAEADRLTLFKTSLVYSVVIAILVGALLAFSGASPSLAPTFGLYAGLMSLRWYARCWTYAEHRPGRVLISDLAYSVPLSLSLLSLVALHDITLWSATLAMLGSATVGFVAFGLADLRTYLRALKRGELGPYGAFWRELSGWALLGVVMSEATANANAYLITFISGPHAFAVVAVGALLMRPVSLVLAAVPDMERPLMSVNLRAGNSAAAIRIVKEFRTAAGAIWLVTVLLAAVLLVWFPHLLIKRDYRVSEVVIVVAITAASMALRALRAPDAVLLQAAGEFRKLAFAGVWSSIAAMAATLVLLLLFGPVVAVVGVLIGEIVSTQRVFALVGSWKRAHV
jgi:O-antigen/teichoic acid export membrane protein